LEILDDVRLASRRDVGGSVVKGECADGRIMCLEDGYKVERQPVPAYGFLVGEYEELLVMDGAFSSPA
jgi:hypothetical protein